MKAVRIARDESVDFLLPVGGGSVFDGTKFIAAAIPFADGDPWVILARGAPVRSAVPLGGNITYTTLGEKIALPVLAIAIFVLLLFVANGSWKTLGDSLAARMVFSVIFIAAIGMREPFLLQHPRFWAEEGLVWFQYGSTHSIFKTLFFVFPVSNYFNLAPNIGAVLSSRVASHLGLLYAPVATTLFAYIIQSSAVISIIFVKSRLFDSLWKAATGCSIMLFAPTTSDEIWLNSINAMAFLGVVTLVLLFAETEGWSPTKRWIARVALLFCGFSSPYAVALLPMFLIRAWRSKGREQKIQCMILVLCLVVQAGVVLKSRRLIRERKTDPMRATLLRSDASAVNMFVEHMLYPALGFSLKEQVLEVSGLKEASVSASSQSGSRIACTASKRRSPRTQSPAPWAPSLSIVGARRQPWRDSRPRATTLAWISAAPSKMFRIRASQRMRLISYSRA